MPQNINKWDFDGFSALLRQVSITFPKLQFCCVHAPLALALACTDSHTHTVTDALKMVQPLKTEVPA